MSDRKKESPFLLIGKYIQGTISPNEVDLLLLYMKDNFEIAELLYKNIQADIWLHTTFQAEREAKDLPFCSLPQEEDPQFGIQKLLEEALAYEKNAVPLPKDPENEAHESNPVLFAQKNRSWSKMKEDPAQRRKESILPLILSLGSLIGLCSWLSLDHYWESHKKKDDPFQALVKIVDVVDPVWKQGSTHFKRGQESGPNEFELEKGMFKLLFAEGTEAILEGPGKFVVSDPNKLFCSQGKISAYVPKSATGFEIATPSGRFIDRGTEFSISVDPIETAVEVYRGKVDASFSDTSSINLQEGKAVAQDKQGVIKTYKSNINKYISPEIFSHKAKEAAIRHIKAKEAIANKWDRDPDLLVHADLWNTDSGRIVNRSVDGSTKIPTIRQIACSSGEGRYPGTKSLEFLRRNDRLEFMMQEEYTSLSLVVSVRINRLSNTGNVLMISRDFFQRSGAVSFQIGKEGNLQFFISGEREEKGKNRSIDKSVHTAVDIPSIFQRTDWGTWIRFAVVLDASSKTIRVFKDGVRISEVPWPNPVRLTPGTVYAGNAPDEQMSKNARFLGGAIDEIYIFNRSLNEDEIRNM